MISLSLSLSTKRHEAEGVPVKIHLVSDDHQRRINEDKTKKFMYRHELVSRYVATERKETGYRATLSLEISSSSPSRKSGRPTILTETDKLKKKLVILAKLAMRRKRGRRTSSSRRRCLVDMKYIIQLVCSLCTRHRTFGQPPPDHKKKGGWRREEFQFTNFFYYNKRSCSRRRIQREIANH